MTIVNPPINIKKPTKTKNIPIVLGNIENITISPIITIISTIVAITALVCVVTVLSF